MLKKNSKSEYKLTVQIGKKPIKDKAF